MERKNWTREELILAFNLYLKLSFGKMHHNNIDVIKLSKIINRTAGSIAMRLGNFASLDPLLQQRGIKGLTGGYKQCKPIWDEFYNNRDELIFESEKILAERELTTIENKFPALLIGLEKLKGESKLREVKTRVNQYVFRQIVIANYNGKCAISGLDIPSLLLASHIIPWSKNDKERLNPENGICLSPLYDKAFDKGFIGINCNYEMVVSNELKVKEKQDFYNIFFKPYVNKSILLPMKYLPNKDFLKYHFNSIFNH